MIRLASAELMRKHIDWRVTRLIVEATRSLIADLGHSDVVRSRSAGMTLERLRQREPIRVAVRPAVTKGHHDQRAKAALILWRGQESRPDFEVECVKSSSWNVVIHDTSDWSQDLARRLSFRLVCCCRQSARLADSGCPSDRARSQAIEPDGRLAIRRPAKRGLPRPVDKQSPASHEDTCLCSDNCRGRLDD
jgi:hypothetical protein